MATTPLTPLESQLKEIILSVYSDKRIKQKSESEPKSDLVGEHTVSAEEALGLRDLATGIPSNFPVLSTITSSSRATTTTGSSQQNLTSLEASGESLDAKQLLTLVRSTPDGSESSSSGEPHALLNSSGPTRPELQQVCKSRGFARYFPEGEKDDIPCVTNKKAEGKHTENSFVKGTPTQPSKSMSDTHSVASTGDPTSSAPIFSADDQNIALVDPDFPPMSPTNQLGSLPYSDTDSHSYLHDNQLDANPIIPGDRSHPVSLDFLNSSPSLLYSFTDPSRAGSSAPISTASKNQPRSGIVNSFGVSPHLYQPRLSKPRQLHSIPPSTADRSTSKENDASVAPQISESINVDSGSVLPVGMGVPELGVPELSVPLPEIIGSESRDNTPTPQSEQDTQAATKNHSRSLPHSEGVTDSVHIQDEPISSSPRELLHTDVFLPVESGSASREMPVVSSVDSDVETASVVSVQELTETYLNDPLDSLIDGATPLSEGGKIPFLLPAMTGSSPSAQDVPSGSPGNPFNPPLSAREPSKVPNKTSQHAAAAELPSPGKLPAHINPSVSKRPLPGSPLSPSPRHADKDTRSLQAFAISSNESPPLLAYSPQVPGESTGADNTGLKLLEERLAEEKKARTYLEGQLEAVKEECEAALRERPNLLSKISRVEAELAEMASALEREKSKPKLKPTPSSEDGHILAKQAEDLQDTREALEQERKAVSSLKGRLRGEEQKSRQLERDLKETRQTLGDQESNNSDLRNKLQKCQTELAKKADKVEEMACKLSSLEAGYDALEKNKSWLHDQLQDAQKAKLKLQEELRESKATGIAYDIKYDQLQKENSALQEQIGSLLKGVLQDKAKMVDQLETIKADVVSHEDLYAGLIAEKAQLEGINTRKDEAVSRLNSDVARAQVEREELKQRLDELCQENDKLTRKADVLHGENKSLSSKLSSCLSDLDDKESDLKELEKIKSSLQDKLRHTDVEAVSKDGTIQSLKDANELLQHELALVSDAKEAVETESTETKSELALLEAELKSALDKSKEKDLQLRSALESRHSMDDQKQMLHALLAEKDKEIEQKDEAVKALEAQTKDVLGEFNTLRDNFKSVASESGMMTDSFAEKDRVISHLAAEKDKSDEELSLVRKENQELHNRFAQLQHERAHLLGQVEGSIDQDEYKKALQDKAQLQDELNSLRVDQKRDEIKTQSKVNRLETELRAAQKTASKAQKELQNLEDEKAEEVSRSNEARSRADADLMKVNERLQKALKDKEKAKHLLDSLKPSEQKMYEMLKSKCEQLMEQNNELTEQLQQATQQKIEVERASGLVAAKLKQNAEREKKELVEKNRDLSLDLERLRGRLAGMQTTQVTMRDHASGLEVALAKKESSIVTLSAEAQNLHEEKLMENEVFATQVATLEKQLKDLNTDVAHQRERAASERQRVEELENELRQHEDDSSNKQTELFKKDSNVLSTMKEQLAALSLEKDALQSDLSYLKSQLLIAKTSAESAKRQFADKSSQVEILERELKIAESRSQQAEEEVKQLKEHLKMANARHRAEPGLRGGVEGKEGSEDWETTALQGSSQPGLFNASLSTINGADETDQPRLGEEMPQSTHHNV